MTANNFDENMYFPSVIINGIKLNIYGLVNHPDISSFYDEIPAECEDCTQFYDNLAKYCRKLANAFLVPRNDSNCDILIPDLRFDSSTSEYLAATAKVIEAMSELYTKGQKPNSWLRNPELDGIALETHEIDAYGNKLASLKNQLDASGIKLLLCHNSIIGIHAEKGITITNGKGTQKGKYSPLDFEPIVEGFITPINGNDTFDINE